MLINVVVNRSGTHLLAMLAEDGHRLSLISRFNVQFSVKDEHVADDVVATYEKADGLVSMKVIK